MDLNAVISELRAELENVKQVTAALEKLYDIRRGQTMDDSIDHLETPGISVNENMPRRRGRPRKQPPVAELSDRS